MGAQAGSELANLITSDLVVNSGAYEVIVDGLSTVLDERGLPALVVPDRGLTDEQAARVLAVSAFGRVGEPEHVIAERLFGDQAGVSFDPVAGYTVGSYAGAVADEDARALSSSGGLTTWLLKELITRRLVDGVIHLADSDDEASPLYAYRISRTVDDVQRGAKTRYFPGHLGGQLREILQAGGRYAVVGIPSVLYEVRLATVQEPALADRIPYFVGLICGHQKSARYADSLAWQVGVEPGAARSIDFRAKLDGRKANAYGTRIIGTGADGSLVDVTLPTSDFYGTDWGLGFFKANFSDFSDDVLNETADVVFGDAWLPEYVDDPRGTNVVLSRSRELDAILLAGARSGELHLDPLPVARVRQSQGGLIRHGRELLPARLAYLRSRSEFVPSTRFASTGKPSIARRHVQRMRVQMARASHSAFRSAVESGEFAHFPAAMRPLTREYEAAYRTAALMSKIKRRFR
ncbi:Coenzyme F420 hydrogenase/dehydrogenase, beta subunit C-terminal domain [Microbacterium trichothecenolyticum]|uniref:Coenzyme F420 hydrogenase/dehydrogenase, beta subunit C-terminal domain n=1 Tax=Microbacterium trichothecenolyticum TaxID=69370 RepID=UPI0035BE21C2